MPFHANLRLINTGGTIALTAVNNATIDLITTSGALDVTVTTS
jgi:hypothetical protein